MGNTFAAKGFFALSIRHVSLSKQPKTVAVLMHNTLQAAHIRHNGP
jgi:hypothetical protein